MDFSIFVEELLELENWRDGAKQAVVVKGYGT